MSSTEYLPELARALDRLLPPEPSLRPAWDDVAARAGLRLAPRRKRRPLRVAVLVAAVSLLLAGAATATYFATRGSGRLTIISPPGPVASIVGLDPQGRLKTVWQCPHDDFCGDVVSVAWAPDGRRLAVSLDEVLATSLYIGLHVVDISTGADLQLPAPPVHAPTPAGRLQALAALRRETDSLFGCIPRDLAWSRDGSRLAYTCVFSRDGYAAGRIFTIRPDGTDRRLLPTRSASAYWPSWSADGKQIAFSTGYAPIEDVPRDDTDLPQRLVHSEIHVVALDGSGDRVVADGAAPDWSPDGASIAYQAPPCDQAPGPTGGTRLVGPDGHDLTPEAHAGSCGGIGPTDGTVAAWSPDAGSLAVETDHGLYLMDADGRNLRQIAENSTGGLFGDARPTWQPQPAGGNR